VFCCRSVASYNRVILGKWATGTFLVRWPSPQAMQHARQRVREITARERLLLPVKDIVQDLNRFLGGWASYFRYGNSAQSFDKITLHAINRLAIFVAIRHQRDRRFGWWVVARQSPDRLGLIDLNGIIVSPRAFRPRHRAR
jgi:RNA-directed DNA polymerase